MKLNRENYGIFIIDYFDGNLSEAEKEQLLLFLDANPDLKKEFKNLDKVTLSKPVISFPEKEKLKIPEIKPTQDIHKDNYESFFVLFHDNELKAEEARELKTFLDKNPHLSKELELFGKIRLEKDEKVVFQGKAALKHRKPVTRQLAFVVAVAAMFLIYFGFKFLQPEKNKATEVKQHARILALEAVPTMTMSLPVISDGTLDLKPKQENVTSKKQVPIIRKQTPVKMLATLGIGIRLEDFRQNTNLFASTGTPDKEKEPTHPVIVNETHKSLLASTVMNPIDRLAGYIALRKREKMESDTHDKPFVKLLDTGVKTFNFLTNNDVLFVKTYNSRGNLTSYQLLSDDFNIDHNYTPAPNGK